MAFTLRLTEEEEKELTAIMQENNHRRKSDSISLMLATFRALEANKVSQNIRIRELERAIEDQNRFRNKLKHIFAEILE